MEQVALKSDAENLSILLTNLREFLEGYDLSMKFQLNLELIVEELFLNVCNYAYPKEDILIQWDIKENPSRLILRFIDNGVQFNPLEFDEPDLTLSAEERQIGGLGIVLVKTNVDVMEYKYENNQNVLTIEKYF